MFQSKKFSALVVKIVFSICCPQEAHLRNSSSPPNSTGSTADSDGWENQRLGCDLSSPDEPPPKNRKSFAGFKRPASEDSEPQKRPKSAGLLLEGRTKADKVKKKKKKLRKSKDEELRSFAPFTTHSAEGEIGNFGCTIKEEPEDYFSISVPTAGMGSDQPTHTGTCSKPAYSSPGTATWKEEPDIGRPCWDGFKSSGPESEDVEKPSQPKEESIVLKVEGFPGKRTVVRQGKQVVFRDEDGSGDDEDIMVDSGKKKVSSCCLVFENCNRNRFLLEFGIVQNTIAIAIISSWTLGLSKVVSNRMYCDTIVITIISSWTLALAKVDCSHITVYMGRNHFLLEFGIVRNRIYLNSLFFSLQMMTLGT